MHQEFLDTKPLTTNLGAILAKVATKTEPETKPAPIKEPIEHQERKHNLSLGKKHNLLEGRVNSHALFMAKFAKRLDAQTEYLKQHRAWLENSLNELREELKKQDERIAKLEKALQDKKKVESTVRMANLIGALLK